MTFILSKAQVCELQPKFKPSSNPIAEAKAQFINWGQFHAGQMAGRRWAVACVSLEVTQRCNLDCTLCYLSEHAEAVKDFPLEEIFRRIDLIYQHYGVGTDVQVSGGEPTLRSTEDLIKIVQYLSSKGLRSSLLTNGIKATRSLLAALKQAGLRDVAFHVDTTQERNGFPTEESLNSIRLEYIERARGLDLGIFFNTTIHAGNWQEIPTLSHFFVQQADAVRFASFQLQADTGRGVLTNRADIITQEATWQKLAAGANAGFNINTLGAGHHDCNRSAVLFVINGRCYDAFAQEPVIQYLMQGLSEQLIERGNQWIAAASIVKGLFSKPGLIISAILWLLRFSWAAKHDLWRARGKVNKLTLFTHNFMDACSLDKARLDTCVFMAITQNGPMSMCAYNAKRDDYLLSPLSLKEGLWQPLKTSQPGVVHIPIKWLKGRAKSDALEKKQIASVDHK
jgi:7,8-dihydro-6-hydroxymethylpterin dimethyltransferase